VMCHKGHGYGKMHGTITQPPHATREYRWLDLSLDTSRRVSRCYLLYAAVCFLLRAVCCLLSAVCCLVMSAVGLLCCCASLMQGHT